MRGIAILATIYTLSTEADAKREEEYGYMDLE